MASEGNFQSNSAITTSPRRPHQSHPNLYSAICWLCSGLAIIAIITVAIVINSKHTDNTSHKLVSTFDIDNGDQAINWDRYPTTDITLTEAVTTVTTSGTYHLTGSLEDGVIVISAASTDKVRLILDNVNLAHDNSPTIFCYKADDLVIELIGDNIISDGTYQDSYNENSDEMVGAIYANADLTFQGEGTLTVTGNYQDAIVSKDDLKFNSGTYYITATDDAIRGTDSVHIIDGNFTINSTADAIKSTNETTPRKGFVLVENGNFNLTAGAKGLKATKGVLIQNGNFAINSHDDAIHSDANLGITNGTFNIASGDDAIHANHELIIDDGNITVAKAYEGLEAQVITIASGDFHLTTSDDGINAGSSNDQSATNNRRGNAFDADENCILAINGGNIYVNASGDGVDSNGWLYFNGGTTIIDGPTNDGNGALDSGMGIIMNGGTVLAIGSSGMAETLSSSSAIYNVSIYLNETQPANTHLEIRDSTGHAIVDHTSAKSFSNITTGTSDFHLGDTYLIYLNDELYDTFTITGVTTTIGTPRQPMMPGPR